MSWNIALYAEVKKDGKWVGFKNALDYYFKSSLQYLDEYIEYSSVWDSLKRVNVDDLSDELKSEYDVESKYFDGREISIKEFRSMCSEIINKHETVADCLFKALGVNYVTTIWEAETIPDKYDDDGEIRANYDPMTYKVNKELFETYNRLCIRAKYASMIMGMIDAIGTMLDDDTNDVRFIMVGG